MLLNNKIERDKNKIENKIVLVIYSNYKKILVLIKIFNCQTKIKKITNSYRIKIIIFLIILILTRDLE